MARGEYKRDVYDFVAAGTKLGINAKLLSNVCGMSPGSIRQARNKMGLSWRRAEVGVKRYRVEHEPHWLAGVITRRMQELGISKYTLAKRAHVGKASLYGILEGRSGMRVESIERLLKELGLKLKVE